jgi:hypothetical protein
MAWSEGGINTVMRLRSAWASGRWDEIFAPAPGGAGEKPNDSLLDAAGLVPQQVCAAREARRGRYRRPSALSRRTYQAKMSRAQVREPMIEGCLPSGARPMRRPLNG